MSSRRRPTSSSSSSRPSAAPSSVVRRPAGSSEPVSHSRLVSPRPPSDSHHSAPVSDVSSVDYDPSDYSSRPAFPSFLLPELDSSAALRAALQSDLSSYLSDLRDNSAVSLPDNFDSLVDEMTEKAASGAHWKSLSLPQREFDDAEEYPESVEGSAAAAEPWNSSPPRPQSAPRPPGEKTPSRESDIEPGVQPDIDPESADDGVTEEGFNEEAEMARILELDAELNRLIEREQQLGEQIEQSSELRRLEEKSPSRNQMILRMPQQPETGEGDEDDIPEEEEELQEDNAGSTFFTEVPRDPDYERSEAAKRSSGLPLSAGNSGPKGAARHKYRPGDEFVLEEVDPEDAPVVLSPGEAFSYDRDVEDRLELIDGLLDALRDSDRNLKGKLKLKFRTPADRIDGRKKGKEKEKSGRGRDSEAMIDESALSEKQRQQLAQIRAFLQSKTDAAERHALINYEPPKSNLSQTEAFEIARINAKLRGIRGDEPDASNVDRKPEPFPEFQFPVSTSNAPSFGSTSAIANWQKKHKNEKVERNVRKSGVLPRSPAADADQTEENQSDAAKHYREFLAGLKGLTAEDDESQYDETELAATADDQSSDDFYSGDDSEGESGAFRVRKFVPAPDPEEYTRMKAAEALAIAAKSPKRHTSATESAPVKPAAPKADPSERLKKLFASADSAQSRLQRDQSDFAPAMRRKEGRESAGGYPLIRQPQPLEPIRPIKADASRLRRSIPSNPAMIEALATNSNSLSSLISQAASSAGVRRPASAGASQTLRSAARAVLNSEDM